MRRALERALQRGDETGVLVGDHQPHPTEPAAAQAGEEPAAEDLVFVFAGSTPRTSPSPVAVIPVASRPPSSHHQAAGDRPAAGDRCRGRHLRPVRAGRGRAVADRQVAAKPRRRSSRSAIRPWPQPAPSRGKACSTSDAGREAAATSRGTGCRSMAASRRQRTRRPRRSRAGRTRMRRRRGRSRAAAGRTHRRRRRRPSGPLTVSRRAGRVIAGPHARWWGSPSCMTTCSRRGSTPGRSGARSGRCA